MRLNTPALAAFMLVGCATGITAAASRSLTFDFPDGYRGGVGKIQGTGEGPAEVSADWLLKKVAGCGLVGPRIPEIQVSHRHTIMGASGPKDRDIALCVKRTVPNHFSVLDESRRPIFPDLWSSPPGDK